MQQQFDYPTQGGSRGASDPYETPTKQLVFLKGKSCIEHVSLPNMQQYYTNVQLLNREYGYFQIAHFDFPLNDSLVKTFYGDTTPIVVTITTKVAFPAQPTQTYTHTQNIDFPVNRTHTSIDIANHLQNKLSAAPFVTNNEHAWLNWLHQIQYDAGAQKLCFILARPDAPYQFTDEDGQPAADAFIERMVISIHGAHPFGSRAQKLAAAIFGGKTLEPYDSEATNDLTWYSVFDTGETLWFKRAVAAGGSGTFGGEFSQYYNVFSQRPTRMFVDPYVYVRGAPEQSVWTSDGLTTDIISVQPRNRPPGAITSEQAFVSDQTHATKTSLSSLRSMNLRFTDSDGHLILLDEEYLIKIMISFQQ